MVNIPFGKYHGLGNDFILIDNRSSPGLCLSPDLVIKYCDRHFGIGADGVIFLLPDQRMRILNADGSEPEMCGNGIRCLAKFMQDLGIATLDNRYEIATKAGLMVVQFDPDGLMTVDMGEPHLLAGEIPTTLGAADRKVINQPLVVDDHEWLVTAVSMGNPHCVVFVADGDRLNLAEMGSKFEHHPAFPERINTEFIEVLNPRQIKMRVWERGAGATLACGTGACAAVVAGVLTGNCDRLCRVHLPGGDLKINWDGATNHVLMTGAAELVFTGTIC